ncbi:hypothetical protein NIES2130_29815 [Scytonema sp. HK-05]|nr:hypothetical protein NIES2130_29815 [Scytonema sp. HK-05]
MIQKWQNLLSTLTFSVFAELTEPRPSKRPSLPKKFGFYSSSFNLSRNNVDRAMTAQNFLVKPIDNILPNISVIFVHSSQRTTGRNGNFSILSINRE